jgi:hypothetical protein
MARFFPNGDDPFDIRDVWPENYSANSVQKVWAARSRPVTVNVAVLDLSSFKCGHDAPTYGIIDKDRRHGEGAVLGAARHRRQQAGWLDPHPREDLRPSLKLVEEALAEQAQARAELARRSSSPSAAAAAHPGTGSAGVCALNQRPRRANSRHPSSLRRSTQPPRHPGAPMHPY